MIEVRGLSKRYGGHVADDDLSFSVQPGVVTRFLGPNGAGKSTTMCLMLGPDAPDAGVALVGGRCYREIPAPLHEVGAMLEARAIHTGSVEEFVAAASAGAPVDVSSARPGELADALASFGAQVDSNTGSRQPPVATLGRVCRLLRPRGHSARDCRGSSGPPRGMTTGYGRGREARQHRGR